MKVFYTGVNLYGQFLIQPDELIIYKFTEVQDIGGDEILFYALALTYSVTVTNTTIIIRGFFHGRPYQNYNINNFDIKSIQQISCNEAHILILDQHGTIWQLKTLNDLKFRPLTNFINIESMNLFEVANDDISKIYCGKNMNLAVTKLGYLYSIPSRLNVNNVRDVACGQEHGILLCENGEVYTWGVGTRGQLGHDDLENQIDPCIVEALRGIKVKKIAAGGWHCAVLSIEGDVYTWGWNSNGQLGFNNDTTSESDSNITTERFNRPKKELVYTILVTPKPVDIGGMNSNIVDIACGMRHTLALRDDGSLYGSGFNKYNQLGIPNESETKNIYKMTQILIMDRPSDKISIKCGPYCSAIISYD